MGVRESGQGPDDPDGRRTCWHHRNAADCLALGKRLERERDTRRLTSIGIDTMIWIHARHRWNDIPQRAFLERFEPTRRWLDGGTPPLGLARGAVLYHLPSSDSLTAAELFTRSNMCARICGTEVEWLEAQRRARFSFFQVLDRGRQQAVLRDWFGELSGRRDVTLEPGELDGTPLAAGQTIFARLVRFRGHHFVDHLQSENSLRVGIVDPAAPARSVWQTPQKLRDRAVMVQTLFETWTKWRKR